MTLSREVDLYGKNVFMFEVTRMVGEIEIGLASYYGRENVK